MSTPIRAALFDMDGVLRHWTGRGRTTAEHSARLPAGTLRRLAYGEAFTLANLGILTHHQWLESVRATLVAEFGPRAAGAVDVWARSEEHTSELQSRFDLVCRLLLEKQKYIL